MKKITILVGPQASGKSTKADEMVKGRKSVTICNPDFLSPFCFERVERDTEVIAFEDLKGIEQVNWIINKTHLTVNKYNSRPFTMERPEIIIIAQKLDEHLLQQHESVEIIRCVHHDPWPVLPTTGQSQL